MKKLKLYIAANAMLIWLIAIILLMMVSVSFGAYTYMKYAKRVVSTVNDNDIPFSSNLLTAVDYRAKQYNDSVLTFSSTASSGDTRTIKIFNYPQNDINAFCRENINYTLSVKVKNPDGTDMSKKHFDTLGINIDVNFDMLNWETVNKDDSDEDVSESELPNTDNEIVEFAAKSTLSGGDKNFDVCILTASLKEGVNPADFDFSSFYLSVTAVPDDNSIKNTSEKILARNFRYIKNVDPQKWEGKFVDDFSMEKTSSKYDGFNYEISGNGLGECTLKWNSEYVEIDPRFMGTLKPEQNPEAENSTLKFKVGGDDTASNYRIQFYRVKPAPDGEKVVNGIVTAGDNDEDKYVVLIYEPDKP